MSTYDPLDVRSQELSKEAQLLRDKLAIENEQADLKWLMGSKRGRRIVWRQLARTGVFRSSFNTNAMSMAFAEGNRNEGLHTLGQIHALCPELYPVMVKEQNE
jgi:hypothetical protein